MRRDRDREEERQHKFAWLREAWEEGLASGEPVELEEDWAERVIARGEPACAANATRHDARGDPPVGGSRSG
ncbi:MAG: hypothetical protein JOY99_00375 [Sphingomonadaceae bacterium]|nr:hypothetical protein [Sphingomonadaceae bacterium]